MFGLALHSASDVVVVVVVVVAAAAAAPFAVDVVDVARVTASPHNTQSYMGSGGNCVLQLVV